MNSALETFDVIICVYACDTVEKYKQQLLKMNEIYNDVLKYYSNIKILYFLGDESTDVQGEQYIHLKNVNNDYLSASYKQFLGLKYIYENYNFKFVMCIGTDTYVNIKKLDVFYRQFDHTESLYIGGHGDKRNLGSSGVVHFHSGGPGFLLSYKCMEDIYAKTNLNTFVDDWIQLCITNNIVDLIPCCDVAIAYLVNLKEINAKTVYCTNTEFTNYNHMGTFIGNYGQQAPINLNDMIACHNMSLTDCDDFTILLKKNNYFL
jgi:hypothetical protein